MKERHPARHGHRPPGRGRAGVTAGSAAGLVWGLAFLVPVLLHGWSAVAVTTGRYLAYGLVSALLFAMGGRVLRGLARQHWRPALAFAITGNAGYYLLLVLGIDLIGAPITDIIIGCIPITLALAGNLTSHTHPWRKLAAPIALATAGLLLATLSGTGEAGADRSAAGVAFGLLAAFGAVALWTWYGLANARFLNRHPQVPHTGWSTLVGLSTGAVTLICLPAALVTRQLHGGSGTHSISWLIGGSIVLGAVVSWGGTVLWNLASARLSTVSAGMLVNVETVAGYAYVYSARAQWPPLTQLLGFALLITGVLIVVRLPAAPDKDNPAAPGGTSQRAVFKTSTREQATCAPCRPGPEPQDARPATEQVRVLADRSPAALGRQPLHGRVGRAQGRNAGRGIEAASGSGEPR
ncbi:MAG TPA: DMT family transporter [Streptosporangiaceae bacterium]